MTPIVVLAASEALALPPRLPHAPAPARVERVRAYWKRDAQSPLALRLEKMIAAAPSLERPTHTPTPWARSPRANFLLATLRSRLGALRRNIEPPLEGRTTHISGEPDITVEWTKDEVYPALPPEAPIVVFLHTITGTAAQTRWLMAYASSRGWRACVFVRRGHSGARMTSPRFNLLGDAQDVSLQLKAVRRAYPRASFLGMIGVSAGSGLLISYLGAAGSAA